jgi:hypothetical protein
MNLIVTVSVALTHAEYIAVVVIDVTGTSILTASPTFATYTFEINVPCSLVIANFYNVIGVI